MLPTIVLPLRNPSEGKTRLAPVLDAHLRRALVEAMFSDVVRAVTDDRVAGMVGDVVVAAQGPEALALAHRHGLTVVPDPDGDGGLVTAVAHATASLADRDVAVIAADLPCLTPGDVQALLHPDVEVVVAPTRRGGTGGLVRRPGGCLVAAYGPDSARRNVTAGHGAGLRVATVDTPGLHGDVDVAGDLTALATAEVGPATSVLIDALLDQVSARRGRGHDDGRDPPATPRIR